MAGEMDNATNDTWRIFRIMSEFVEGFESLGRIGQAVSIFGSARTAPSDPFYQAAEQTARLLSQSGFAVITGGGPGIMEAGNKGAFEAGGQSIGLNITLPQEQHANRYQTLTLDFHYFYARKVMFVKYAQAFICFPGGYGTLDEFFETMTLIQTMKVEAFPVVLYGSDYWTGLVDWIRKQLKGKFIDGEDLDIFRIVDSPSEAAEVIKEGVKKHWWRPEGQDLPGGAGQEEGLRRGPMQGINSTDSGEGTRYGQRPIRSGTPHANPGAKPPQ